MRCGCGPFIILFVLGLLIAVVFPPLEAAEIVHKGTGAKILIAIFSIPIVILFISCFVNFFCYLFWRFGFRWAKRKK